MAEVAKVLKASACSKQPKIKEDACISDILYILEKKQKPNKQKGCGNEAAEDELRRINAKQEMKKKKHKGTAREER